MRHAYVKIESLDGNQPIGAALTVGTKGDRGFPIDRDKFYIKTPVMADGVRAPHPAFALWHSKATPDQRKVIRGNIVHGRVEDCFEHYLRNQSNKGSNPPNKQPFCVGDGRIATRWTGQQFEQIPCPHELCEFRQGNVKACKPFARLLFMPRWAEGSPLPQLLTKYTTASWNTVRNLLGFFGYAKDQAEQMGIENPSLFGLPFELELTKKTSPAAKTAYPVVTITPTMSLVEFFAHQRRQMIEAGSSGVPKLLSIGDPPQQDPEEVFADLVEISPGIPSPDPAPAASDPITFDQVSMLEKLGAGVEVQRMIKSRFKVDLVDLPASKLDEAQRFIAGLARSQK